MVFSSIPAAYHDPPNWHHLQSHPPNHHQPQQFGGIISNTGGSIQLLPPSPPPPYSGGGGGAGSIRPGSMTDRARMANIPMPEAALKCPRCESTNTKFCYFNNYSLSQPRHFCKTCRRYWTRGGALRSVPVGGGCRRNKRTSTKPSSSKSPAASGDHQTCSSSFATSVTSTGMADHALGLGPPALRYMMAPLHNFADLSAGEFGLNYGGLSNNNDLSFHFSGVTSTTGTPLLALRGSVAAESSQQWRPQQSPSQFPFFGEGLDPPPAAELLYPYDHQGGHVESLSSTFVGQHQNQVRPKAPATSGVVKMEDDHDNRKHQQNQNQDQVSLSRKLLGNEQFWSGVGANAWNDLSGFTSSSTSHP